MQKSRYKKAKARKTNKSFSQLYKSDNVYYNIPETKIKVTDESKFKIVDEVLNYAKEKKYSIIDADGCRVQFDDGWALVRASNTGPNLTIRYEASSQERLKEIQNEFDEVVNKAVKENVDN